MLLIFRQPSVRTGWWDALFALWDLAEAIYVIPKATLLNNFYRVWEKASHIGVSNLGLPLHPISLDLHQSQIQPDENLHVPQVRISLR